MANEVFLFIETQGVKVIIAIWLILAISNRSKRNILGERLENILKQPILPTFSEQDSTAIINNTELEVMAKNVYHKAVDPLIKLDESLKEGIKNQFTGMRKEMEKPGKGYGYILQFILLSLFLYAEIVAITVTLQAIGFVDNPIRFFDNLELAVTIGSVVSIIVGGFVAHEIFGVSEHSDWGNQKGFWKAFGATVTLILIITGLGVVIGLGLARFSILIELTPTWDFYIKWYSTFVINVLVPVNAALAVLLIHKDGLKGLQLLTYVAAWLMSGLLSFLIYMGHIFGALGQVGLDIMLRIIIVVLIIAVYIITTPLDAINQRVSSPYKEKPAINT